MKHKVLIVDDEPSNLEFMVHIFEEMESEFNVLQSSDGEMAMRVLEDQQPDLVITDWKMPNCNGINLLRQIRQNESFANLPVIVYSGVMTCPECVVEALNEGATDFIHKPIRPIELIARSRSMLKLADSYKQVRELNAAKDLLFNMIAHDLKNSVGGLNNLLELMSDKKYIRDCNKQTELIERASCQAKKSYNLLDNLLNWARTQMNNFKPELQKVKLHEVLHEVCEEFDTDIKTHHIQLSLECNPDLVSWVDKDMLRLMVRNVLGNSIKFTPQSGIINIKAHCESTSKQNMLVFTDSGCGISQKDLQYITRENKFVKQYGVRGETGNGIGLKLVRELTRLNNGELDIFSKEGEGTTVTISIPSI